MPTIAEIATGSEDFDILVGALGFVDAELESSDLIAALSDSGNSFTVFAPTDTAFTRLAVDAGFGGDTSDETAVTGFLAATFGADTLFDVITYHVLTEELSAADIAGRSSITTLAGGTIGTGDLPTLVDAEPDLLDPSLVTTDIAADNGIVHVIDRVLIPVDLPGNDAPTITEIVASSGGTFDNNGADFDILLNAVLTAGLEGALADPHADLTVFAPDDDAFIATAQAFGFTGDDEGDAFDYIANALALLGGGDAIPLLTGILTYHVVPEGLQSSEVLELREIDTLQGGTIIRNGIALRDEDPDVVNPRLTALDIQAGNGIVHVIDGVLLPLDVTLPDAPSDFVVGSAANEVISTGAGADLVHGGAGSDAILAGSAADLVIGGRGRDFVFGHAGRDTIFGEAGADRLRGGRGDDTIDGGAGNDVLLGGRGEDTFVFTIGGGRDIIRDLTEADMLDLTDFGFHDFADFHASTDIDRVDTGTRIDFGEGDILLLRGVHPDDLEGAVLL